MEQKRMHINLTKKQTPRYVFVPGSIERVEKIAKLLSKPKFVTRKREYLTYEGYIDGQKVLVISTGIGGPSTTICLEELVKNGADTFIRIGSCASVSKEVEIGDVVIPNGAVRMDGASYHYAKKEFPAVPNFQLLTNLVEATNKLGYNPKVGVTITKDSFYTQTEPDSKPIGDELKFRWNSYIKTGATNTAMEEASLFIAGSSLNVRTGSVLVSATNHVNLRDSRLYTEEDELKAIKVGIEAMRITIKQDKKQKKNKR